MLIQKDDLDEVEPEITNLLKERVHDCLQNPEFGDLPMATIYKIISSSSEPVENDLLYDFIKKSLDTRYVLFTFLNIENLSAERFNDLVMLLSNCDDQSLRKYKLHIQYDLLYLKSKKDKIDSLTIVLSTMMPILCKVPPDVLIPILPRDLSLIFSKIDNNSPGILCMLKNQSQNQTSFIISQSSNDICHVIDKNAKDYFSLFHTNDYIEIKLPREVSISGIKIASFLCYFPKKFDILIDNEIVHSNNSNDLNGAYKEMIININPRNGRSIKFINGGENCEQNEDHQHLGKIEILSNDPEYQNGVFDKLIRSSKSHDPHKCEVLFSATNFDFHSFYLIGNSKSICTSSDGNLWFQIEFINGLAVLTGFRLAKCRWTRMKNFKVIATDDCNKLLNAWTTLIEVNEHQNLFDIFTFENPSPLIKFIRIVQIGKTWEDRNYMAFHHLDFFGYYFNI